MFHRDMTCFPTVVHTLGRSYFFLGISCYVQCNADIRTMMVVVFVMKTLCSPAIIRLSSIQTTSLQPLHFTFHFSAEQSSNPKYTNITTLSLHKIYLFTVNLISLTCHRSVNRQSGTHSTEQRTFPATCANSSLTSSNPVAANCTTVTKMSDFARPR